MADILEIGALYKKIWLPVIKEFGRLHTPFQQPYVLSPPHMAVPHLAPEPQAVKRKKRGCEIPASHCTLCKISLRQFNCLNFELLESPGPFLADAFPNLSPVEARSSSLPWACLSWWKQLAAWWFPALAPSMPGRQLTRNSRFCCSSSLTSCFASHGGKLPVILKGIPLAPIHSLKKQDFKAN